MGLPKVLIADHLPVVLAGLQTLLGRSCEIVGQVHNGRALVSSALSQRPHLIILSIGMPILNGIEAARQIKKRWPGARLLFFTVHADLVYLKQALEAGARGFVLKTSGPEELRTGIDTVLNGGTYISPSFGPEVLEEMWRASNQPTRSSGRLSERQREILQLITEGQSNKKIAAVLKISVKTVEFHRVQMMQKLRVHTAAELAIAAVRLGMVVEPDRVGIGGQMLDRKALEGLWRSRLDVIKSRFDLACSRLKETQRDWQEGVVSSSDGDFAFKQVLVAEINALADYNRVLRIYSDLTIYGKVPGEVEPMPGVPPEKDDRLSFK